MTAATATEHLSVAPAIVAATIAGLIAMVTLIASQRRSRSDRQRELFGAAFGDVASYCEFPYMVRRRRHDTPEAERLRITTELSTVQHKLNHNRAVLQVEAARVARAYVRLVDATRAVAGGAIRDGWDLPPITEDGGVHVSDVDLTAIQVYEQEYLVAVGDHLALTPWWLRFIGRWLIGSSRRLWNQRTRRVRAANERSQVGVT